ncbi:unnamed protein product [Rotaria sp. Silwood2]|nr:unnamed protein product [Rotaria sp. Silwood2]
MTNYMVSSGYYSRHVLPIKIISKRPRMLNSPSIDTVVANLDEIYEVSSISESRSESRESRRRSPSPVVAGGISLCCMWGMIAAIVLLAAGLITAILSTAVIHQLHPALYQR